MEMSKAQADHLKSILKTAERLISDKYIKGAAEHQSILLEDYTITEVLDMAIEEAVDQITYLLSLKEMIRCATFI